MRRTLATWLCAAAGCAAISAAHADPWRFTVLEPLPGGTYMSVYDINDRGQVVGVSSTSGRDHTVATLWNGSAPVNLDRYPNVGSTAYGIDNAGRIVGWAYNTISGPFAHATLWQGDTRIDLGALGDTTSYAFANNERGWTVGFSLVPNGQHAVLWRGTAPPIDLDPAGNESAAQAINERGQIVGYTARDIMRATLWNGVAPPMVLGALEDRAATDAHGIDDQGDIVGTSWLSGGALTHAVLWARGSTTPVDLGTLGGTYSNARDINDAGWIVGDSFLAGDAITHATLWTRAGIVDLNTFLDASSAAAGWTLVGAQAINERGWITGIAVNSATGEVRGFVLSPIPEPATWVLMAVGLIGMAGARRRR